MRWTVFLLLACAFALIEAALVPLLPAAARAWRIELLFLLAFRVSMHVRPREVAPAFFLAGLARDLVLSEYPGASVLLYTLAALAVGSIRGRVLRENLVMSVGLAFVLLFALLLLRPALELRLPALLLERAVPLRALTGATAGALASPLLGLLLYLVPVRPWRPEADGRG